MGGVNKALLEVGGHRIIERIVGTLSQTAQEIFVVTNTPADYAFLHLPMLRDVVPGAGSLGGLYTGLSACADTRGFLVACDMPFLNAEVIRYMAGLAYKADVVVPRIRGLLEPLHAIYSAACIPHIAGLLHNSDLKILNLYDKVEVLEVSEQELAVFDPNLHFIMNVNTPEDLQQARRLVQEIDQH